MFFQKSSGIHRPRVWWCPTAEFSFLPLHAAGVYHPQRKDSVIESCSDYMVSSYTPTLAALISARRTLRTMLLSEVKVMPVAVPNAPKLLPLKNTTVEIDIISRIVPPSSILPPDSGAPTVGSIIAGLSASDPSLSPSILHLACHGQQDPRDALESGFAMQDGLLTISKLMQIEMPNAFFAFLSACGSAMGDRRQPHETVHLAASMLFVGYRSVLATMWYAHPTFCLVNIVLLMMSRMMMYFQANG